MELDSNLGNQEDTLSQQEILNHQLQSIVLNEPE